MEQWNILSAIVLSQKIIIHNKWIHQISKWKIIIRNGTFIRRYADDFKS